MKKLLSLFLAVCITFATTGCGRIGTTTPPTETDNNNTTEDTGSNIPQRDGAMVAVSVPTITETVDDENGTTLFIYTYQHMSLVLDKPDVADKIIIDFLNRIDRTREAANTVAAMAKSSYNGGANWIPYNYHVAYSPMRIDQKVLSLFGNNVVFSGAGHPERTCVSASYDLLTGDVLTLASIMTKDAKAETLSALVLEGLKEIAEANYLYTNYTDTVKNRFNFDLSKDEAWYFTETGLCFYFVPYEIAPYSAGVISIEIPYEKLTNTIHEDYLPTPQSPAEGTLDILPFEQIKLDDFSHIAEIIADKDGVMYMAKVIGSVQDVRIIYTDDAGTYAIFAADSLNAGDGLMIQTTEHQKDNMKLTFKSGEKTVTLPFSPVA